MLAGMEPRVIMASEFKAQCLALLDQVARTRTPIVVTKHGRPVAKVVPLDDERRPTMGSVQLHAREDSAYYGTGEDWEASRR
jgi:prevent-host-death family protein